MKQGRPTLDIDRDYRLMLHETLLQQSQYLKTNPGFGPADAVCLVPDAYRFPPQDEDLRLLQCEDNVSARQENVNNLL